MARTRAVFQVWLVATGTAMGTSTLKATTVISGRLRQTGQTLGTVNWVGVVVALESIGTTASIGAVCQFVAFGIKNVGLWGA